MLNQDRAYATDNGFYSGDHVETMDGKKLYISEIVEKGRWTWLGEMQVPCSIVKLSNGQTELDTNLTRIE